MNLHRSLASLSSRELVGAVRSLLARHARNTGELLLHLAEIDERRLYRDEAFSSMFQYCVGALHMSEDVAFKRIQAARAGRKCAALLDTVADGRLHLTAVVLIAPHLAPGNAGELIAMATHRSKAVIEQRLAERFPRPDVATVVRAIPGESGGAVKPCEGACAPASQLVPEPVGCRNAEATGTTTADQCRPNAAAAGETIPVPAPVLLAPARVTPLAPQRFALQVTLGQETHDLLLQAQALLGHAVPAKDVEQVLNRALHLLVKQLEKRRLAATDKPRPPRAPANPRTIPAHVKRKVRCRDGVRCTFVSDRGHRCEERSGLEFDHVVAVARGGTSITANLRLRCRAHNQLEAERTFGAGVMHDKREAARARRASAKVHSGATVPLAQVASPPARGQAAPSVSSPAPGSQAHPAGPPA